jgi:hypothetical protein
LNLSGSTPSSASSEKWMTGTSRVSASRAALPLHRDNSLTAGIGRRLDGWPNRDLNVGTIVGLSPAIPDDAFSTWGPESTIRATTRSTGQI